MSYAPQPTVDGVYRIRLLNQNLCIESDPTYYRGAGIKLTSPSSSNDKQKWILTHVPDQVDTWTIYSFEDQSGLTCRKDTELYWGYGYPLPENAASENWNIVKRTSQGHTFSTIHLEGNSNCFDSCDPGSDWVHFYYRHENVSDAPRACYVFELIPPEPPKNHALDVMFLQDFTGSQQPYINAARNEIQQICTNLVSTGSFAPDKLRFSVVAFRDHPPQDQTFVTKTLCNFTTDVGAVASALGTLSATGGGDGPEAVTDALADGLEAPWSDDPTVTKVAILLTDAPPHGLKERGDAWPTRCPCQKDPCRLADRMSKVGITLYVVASEPTMSRRYQHARPFYEGLTQKTCGKVYNLGDPSALSTIIVGCALQEADNNALVAYYRTAIRCHAKTPGFSPDTFAQHLHTQLSAQNVHHHTLSIESMVEPNSEADKIAKIWAEAKDLDDGNSKITNAASYQLKQQYQGGGTPTPALEKKPISIDHVHAVVKKSLARQA